MPDSTVKCPICDFEYNFHQGGHGNAVGSCPYNHYVSGGHMSGRYYIINGQWFGISSYDSQEEKENKEKLINEAIAAARDRWQRGNALYLKVDKKEFISGLIIKEEYYGKSIESIQGLLKKELESSIDEALKNIAYWIKKEEEKFNSNNLLGLAIRFDDLEYFCNNIKNECFYVGHRTSENVERLYRIRKLGVLKGTDSETFWHNNEHYELTELGEFIYKHKDNLHPIKETTCLKDR